jgi:Protein of unknown function (DUF2827)
MDIETLDPARTQGDPGVNLVPFTRITTRPLTERQVILLATATITEDNVFANGLFQNVFVLYRMFDAMGYAPILFINTKPQSLENIPPPLRSCRMITTEDIFKEPIRHLLGMIEIGMSFDVHVRRHVRQLGGRRWKLYLGNILNIDIETPMFYPTNFFAHHVVDELDAIWVSPHYAQHAEYAAYINHLQPPEVAEMIAPYVWDPSLLDRNAPLRWEPGPPVLVIMEPNISFQKTALVPLLIAKAAGWKGKIVVINGDRLKQIPHFVENIAPYLGPMELLPRHDIRSVMQLWPSATFLLHNVNNEFNYMTLELIWAGFPVLHNSPSWSAFGYSYDDIAQGVQRLEQTLGHADRRETYAAHGATLAWRYSPYNPQIQSAWKELLK